MLCARNSACLLRFRCIFLNCETENRSSWKMVSVSFYLAELKTLNGDYFSYKMTTLTRSASLFTRLH